MKKKVTAAELMARLHADADYVTKKKIHNDEFLRKEQESARAEAPLVEELRSAGSVVDSVWDFANGRVGAELHALILPILAAHLQRQYPDAIRDGIARAMAIPEAKFAWPLLVKQYGEEKGRRAKDGLAVALSNIVDDETLEELITLARDARHGESRLLLLSALERSRLPKARKALIELSKDVVLEKEVQRILRR